MLAETVKSASDTFYGLREQHEFPTDYDSLDERKDLRVIVAPDALKLAIGHILDNIAKLTEADSDIRISWNIRELADTEHGFGSRRVELVASNTGTPQTNVHKITLHGLRDVDSRLKEYGGELEILDPTPPWTFQIAIRLIRWTEVKL